MSQAVFIAMNGMGWKHSCRDKFVVARVVDSGNWAESILALKKRKTLTMMTHKCEAAAQRLLSGGPGWWTGEPGAQQVPAVSFLFFFFWEDAGGVRDSTPWGGKKLMQNPAVMTGCSEMSHYTDNKGLSRIILMLRITVLTKPDISAYSCLHQGFSFLLHKIFTAFFFFF